MGFDPVRSHECRDRLPLHADCGHRTSISLALAVYYSFANIQGSLRSGKLRNSLAFHDRGRYAGRGAPRDPSTGDVMQDLFRAGTSVSAGMIFALLRMV